MAPSGSARSVRRGQEGYEQARREAVWNARTPERFPELIVLAQSVEDVQRAVALAREQGLKVCVRSGGHSWAGNHLRDGSLLLDLSRLNQLELDVGSRRAVVGPGHSGHHLLAELAEHGLFFPTGHCPGVGLGGYLLQGGFGWNGRVHGPACMSVEAIDVVTADGELIRADEHRHSDLLWAARGSGPGFFGVVTGFHLRLYGRPEIVANALYLYPLEVLEELFTWAAEIGPAVAREMELMLFAHRDEHGEPELVVTGPVLVDTDEQAKAALALLETSPVLDRAKVALPDVRGSMEDLFAGAAANYPDGSRYAADNMWTHAPVDQLLPGLRRIAETLPEAPSHMLWMNWNPGRPAGGASRPDMAFSVEDDIYIALYGVWEERSHDAANVAWATERMREMEPLSSGIQLADENLGQRPGRFLADQNHARLREIRASYDPEGLFHAWMEMP